MKKNLIWIVLVLLLVGGGLYVLVGSKSPEKMTKSLSAGSEANNALSSNTSRYIEYSKTVLDNAKDKRRVLYFYASWCPICRVGNENFLANADKIPEDVVVIRTNYNDPDTNQEEKDLAKKYGITYQHTFVQIDAQGNEVAKWLGGEIEELLANIK